MKEPIFLKPIYKDYIWGGTRLKEEYNKTESNKEVIAETWEISTNKNGKSLIKNNAEYNYNNLDEIYKNKEIREDIFGSKCKETEEFPILIKFIDANKHLSVQVHPDDNYAKKYENSSGKTEMWYVLDCKKDSKLVCGMKDNIKQNDIQDIVKNNKVKESVNYVNIKKGDIIYIPSGTIHAILEGALICEVQQNCDLTYRVYDWDRVDKNGNKRELHIDKAIDVINVNSEYFIKNIDNKLNLNACTEIISTPYFKIEMINVNNSIELESNKETFYAMNVLEGNGRLKTYNNEYIIEKGDSFIIPAKLGKFNIEGELKIINSYI